MLRKKSQIMNEMTEGFVGQIYFVFIVFAQFASGNVEIWFTFWGAHLLLYGVIDGYQKRTNRKQESSNRRQDLELSFGRVSS